MREQISDFMVGMAKEDITPELGCLLYGYPFERRAERIMDPLMVSAIAISQAKKTVLLISADLCVFNVDKCEDMRKTIAEETGVEWLNILFSTIHTHSGPVTRTNAGWGTTDLEYLDNILVPATMKAVKKAIAGMQPAVMGVGTSETMAGVNRRQIAENGEVILGQNPEGPYDPTMTLVDFKSVTGEMIGSIIHFAAHPTAAARNLSFTRDWPGLMVDRISEITGAPCMFVNGAEGDVGPRLSNGRTGGGESYVIEAGTIAAFDAEKAYRSIGTYRVPALKVAYGDILLPFVLPAPLREVEEKMAELESDPENLKGVRLSQYDQLQKVKAAYDSGEQFPKGVTIKQTVVALGDLVLIPACFEVFCNIALAIREGSPYKHTILLGLTGGTFGYLPTKDQIPFGGYEVDSFRTIGVVSMVDDTDKYFVDQNLEMVQQLYAE